MDTSFEAQNVLENMVSKKINKNFHLDEAAIDRIRQSGHSHIIASNEIHNLNNPGSIIDYMDEVYHYNQDTFWLLLKRLNYIKRFGSNKN